MVVVLHVMSAAEIRSIGMLYVEIAGGHLPLRLVSMSFLCKKALVILFVAKAVEPGRKMAAINNF